MRYLSIAILGVAIVACSSLAPVPIRAGDVCFRCARVITEPRLGAQVIRTNGEVSTFRTPGCLATYLQEHPEGIKTIYVTDYETGTLFPVTGATFVRATIDSATHERDFLAFRSVTDAAKRAKDEYSAVIDWSTVRTISAPPRKTD